MACVRYVCPALIVAAGLLAVLPTPAPWVEALYARRFYPTLQNLLTPLTGSVPFALFDLLLAGVAVCVAVWWITALRRAGGRTHALLAAGLRTIALGAAIYLLFLVVWGFNYRREPLAAQIGHDARRVTPRALAALGLEAADRLNALHASLPQAAWSELDALPDRLGPALARVQRLLGNNGAAVVGAPKATLLAPYFRWAGIDGMISPFTLEILVNAAVLPVERPYVVAHEWAHLAGYATESEASFVGWLTCLAGDDASRYSAWLYLLPHVVRHLDEAARGRVWGRLAPGPAADLRAVARRLRTAVPLVQRNAGRVYDRYLRANRVEAGIASYGEVVDLVLGTTSWRSLPGRQGVRGGARVPAARSAREMGRARWYDGAHTMFKLVATVRGGATNAPAAASQYASAEAAREAAKQLMHEHQRVVRVMIVEEPSRFVEWLDRS